MCGILFVLSDEQEEDELSSLPSTLILPQLHRRGPDVQSELQRTAQNGKFLLHFHGTVLHLRGRLVKQPVGNERGDVLLWNGEVFAGLHIGDTENDTEVIFSKLEDLSTDAEYVNFFTSIRGPWAFVYYSVSSQQLWYGRDYLGRRSLLNISTDHKFVLSSVGHKEFTQDCVEVPAKTLYCLRLNHFEFGKNIEDCITAFPIFPTFLAIPPSIVQPHRCLTAVRAHLRNDCNIEGPCETNGVCGHGISQHKNSHKQMIGRCFDPKPAEKHPKPDEKQPIELSNASCSQLDGKRCCVCIHKRDINQKMSLDLSYSECEHGTVDYITNSAVKCSDAAKMFLCVLEQSVRTRVFNLPRVKEISLSGDVDRQSMMGTNVGILFSGGIDSAVLAALAHRCVPPSECIDLINVAFQQKPHVPQNVKKKYQKTVSPVESANFNVPDRLTGREAVLELSPERLWNFVEVDVSLEQLQKERNERIASLVYPLNSVLDDSIGCAIWFAARGIGKRYVITSDRKLQLQEECYRTPVKVLLTGMGADEQLGGYARHRTKFESGGWTGLIEEMNMEIDRISSRNLGRDDRCISDHGRESRFPFLDESVVEFLRDTPACVKCDPRLPRGEGEKILLREVAQLLNLPYCSQLPKRAIQFGSKIAKLESSKEKGNDTCSRLK